MSVPSTVTAGVPFNVMGQVEDGENASRGLISAVRLNVFWLENPEEILLSNFATTATAHFNMTVPTDTAGNGTREVLTPDHHRGQRVLAVLPHGDGPIPVQVMGVPPREFATLERRGHQPRQQHQHVRQVG